MTIHVIAPNVDTRLTNHPNTDEEGQYRHFQEYGINLDLPVALDELTFKNTNPVKRVQSMSEGHGTPQRLTRANIRGAFPSTARP